MISSSLINPLQFAFFIGRYFYCGSVPWWLAALAVLSQHAQAAGGRPGLFLFYVPFRCRSSKKRFRQIVPASQGLQGTGTRLASLYLDQLLLDSLGSWAPWFWLSSQGADQRMSVQNRIIYWGGRPVESETKNMSLNSEFSSRRASLSYKCKRESAHHALHLLPKISQRENSGVDDSSSECWMGCIFGIAAPCTKQLKANAKLRDAAIPLTSQQRVPARLHRAALVPNGGLICDVLRAPGDCKAEVVFFLQDTLSLVAL